MTGNPYFGEKWDAPATDEVEQEPTPVGVPCLDCGEPIIEGDRGFLMQCCDVDGWSVRPIHRECQFRNVMGGWGHHTDHDYWCGVMHDPDGGLGRRESSLRVWARYV